MFYYFLGRFDLALRDLDRALELDPTDIGAYGRRAFIHATEEDFRDCAQAYEDVDWLLQLAPDTQIIEEIQETVNNACSR